MMSFVDGPRDDNDYCSVVHLAGKTGTGGGKVDFRNDG